MLPRNPSHFAEILVCLDGSSYSQAAVEYATQIALEHNASLTGIGVIDLPGIQRSSGPAPIGAMHYDRLADQQHLEETREVVSGVLKDFGRHCQEKGIHHSIHSETGSPFREIIEESKFHDFIIIGQKTFFRYNIKHEPGNTLDRILHSGLTPVLAVPDSVRQIKKVLGDYFRRYGVQTEKVQLRGRVDEAILSYIREHEIDLLVMGAYGKRSVSEFVFGSVTKSLVEQAGIPLFIYH